MEITINPDLVSILEQRAEDNHKTPEEMAAHYLEKTLIREYKESVKAKIEAESIEIVKEYNVAVSAIKAELEAAREAEFLKNPPPGVDPAKIDE
jgi:hypothetical protein